ncbi:MAG: STAS domain-containing protein [Acidobacteria bacterium]|nr:STAS domain-containing protein [Acidobacteriota bacterium]
MRIETRAKDGVTIVDLHGKITIGEGNVEIRNKVRELLQSGKKKILINLGDVSYMDSSGIGELVSCYTSVTNQGGQLKLLNLTQKLEELLAITKLLTVFDSYNDENKAVQSFYEPAGA